MSQSEVARLLQEIQETYTAAQNGLHGLAQGTARHEFITKKMEHIEHKRVTLVSLIGEQQAMQLLTEALKDF